MSSKKGKKSKGKTLTLTDFLQETSGAAPILPLRKSTSGWADDVDYGNEHRINKTVILPTAPKASRDFDDISNLVPKSPPYIAYLTNLPYDVDETQIETLFEGLKIANMKIPKDERPGEGTKLKGYGYVEFENRDSLLEALIIQDTTIKNRRIRIEPISDYDTDKRKMGRSDMNRDRFNRGSSDSSLGDWRSGHRPEIAEPERRSFTRDRERDRDDIPTAWRDNTDRKFKKDTERSFTRNFNKYKDERDGDSTSGERKFVMDRSSMNTPDRSSFLNRDPKSAIELKSEPRARPKLMLAPRTKPLENVLESSSTSASIFGQAKPVDTSIRERQIEERLEKQSTGVGEDFSKERKIVTKEFKDSNQQSGKNKDTTDDEAESKEAYTAKDCTIISHDINGIMETSKTGEQGCEESEQNKIGLKQIIKSEKRGEEKREKVEKELRKVSNSEPLSFVGSNKFAFLENEDSSE